MSYILDALRRAEAERRRGAVPDLQTPVWPVAPVPASRRIPWGVMAFTAGLLGAGAFALWWFRVGHPTDTVAAAPPIQPIAAKTVEPPVPATSKPAPEPLAKLKPSPAPPASRPAPPARRADPAPTPAHPPQSAASIPVPTRGTPTPATSTASPPPWISDLPETLRQQLPPLTITGSVYSENPTQRLLIINGQVWAQGTTPAPGVTIETIGRQSTILRWQDRRLRVPH